MADYNGTLRKGLTNLYRHLPVKFQSPLTAFAPEADDTYDCRPPAAGDLPPTWSLRAGQANGYVKLSIAGRDSTGKVTRSVRYEALDAQGEYLFTPPAVPLKFTQADGTRLVFKEWSLTPAGGSATTLALGQSLALTADSAIESLYIPETRYNLTVTGGTGGATCVYVGDTVTLVADEPADGKYFAGWTGLPDGNTGAGNPIVKFTMPEMDLVIEATFADVPETFWELILVGGWCESSAPGFTAGTRCAIHADAPAEGKAFLQWTGGHAGALADPYAAATYLTMPAAAVTLTAAYRDVDVWLPTLTLTQGDGATTTRTCAVGERVAVSAATPAGRVFTGWTGSGAAYLDDALAAATTLTVPQADVSLAVGTAAMLAPATYPLTVAGELAGSYPAGAVIAVDAPPAAAGKIFSQWTGDVACLDSAALATTHVTMPAAAVALVPEYRDADVTQVVLTASVAGFAATLALTGVPGAVVMLDGASLLPEGHRFKGWTGAGAAYLASATSLATQAVLPEADASVVMTVEAVTTTELWSLYLDGEFLGDFLAGDVVNIKAVPAAGKVFDRWTGDTGTVDDVLAISTHLHVISGNMTLTSTYIDAPEHKHQLTVVDGTGSGQRLAGESVAIAANNAAEGKVFDRWTGAAAASVGNVYFASTVFTMPDSDTTLTPTFKAVVYPHYSVYVNGELLIRLPEGSVWHVSHTVPAGQVFSRWYGDNGSTAGLECLPNVYANPATLIMPARTVYLTGVCELLRPRYYPLTVTNGTGSGSYLDGATVDIQANPPPAGQTFSAWTGDVGALSNPNSTYASVRIAAPGVAVKATYVTKPTTRYKLTVYTRAASLTSWSKYMAPGESVVIFPAYAAGYAFKLWQGWISGLANPLAAATVFTMPDRGDCSVHALLEPVVPSLPHRLTVHGGSGTGDYVAGVDVPLTAAAPAAGYMFDKWTCSGCQAPRSLDNNPYATDNLYVTMPGNDCWVRANYKAIPAIYYTVAVTGGGVAGGSATSSGYTKRCLAGEAVFVEADVRAGYHFTSWQGTIGCLASSKAAATSFTMPAYNVSLSAAFERDTEVLYNLTVVNGTAADPSGAAVTSMRVMAGRAVAVTADMPAAGHVFDSWTGVGLAQRLAPATGLTMPALDLTVTASFKLAPNTQHTLTVYNHATGTSSASLRRAGEWMSMSAPEVAGRFFERWGASVASALSPSPYSQILSFVMPASNMRLDAYYSAPRALNYRLTVVNGHNNVNGLSWSYVHPNTDVGIEASTPPQGYVFDQWAVSGSYHVHDKYSRSTTVTVTKDTNAVALYKPANYCCYGGDRSQSAHAYMTAAEAGTCRVTAHVTTAGGEYAETIGLTGWVKNNLVGLYTLPASPGVSATGGAFRYWVVSGGGLGAVYQMQPFARIEQVRSDLHVTAEYAPAYYKCLDGACVASDTPTTFTGSECVAGGCARTVTLVSKSYADGDARNTDVETVPLSGGSAAELTSAFTAPDPGPAYDGGIFKHWASA